MAGTRAGVRIVALTLPVKLAIPSLLISSIPKRAIGFSFEAGPVGGLIGASLLGGSLLLGGVLYQALGPLSVLLPLWLMGTTGAVMVYNSGRSLAFVKPLCTGCRLLPIIREHEAMHIGGIESDRRIWDSVRGKYSFEALSLGTDPKICRFCPIARHLRES